MLREENFFRKMCWFNICRLFIERGSYVWIYGIIGRIVDTVIDFFDFNAVILSIIFLCNWLEFNYSNICPFLDYLKDTIIKSRSSFQIWYLFWAQSKLLVNRVYYDVTSFFKQLFVDFIISVVILHTLFFNALLAKRKIGCIWFDVVISRIIVIWSWLHLRKLKGFWCRFSIYNCAGGIHLSTNVLLISSSHVVYSVKHHH